MIPRPDIPLGTWRVKSIICSLVIWEKSSGKDNFRMIIIQCFKVIAIRVCRYCQFAGLRCLGLSSFLTSPCYYRLFSLCMYEDALHVLNLPVSLINTKAFCTSQLVCLCGTFPDHLPPAPWKNRLVIF